MMNRFSLVIAVFSVVLVVGCGADQPGAGDAGSFGGGVAGGGTGATGGGSTGGGSTGGGSTGGGSTGGGSTGGGSTGGGSATGGGTGGSGGGTSGLSQGAACGADPECTSGFCVDGVCCDVGCEGQCQACSAARTGGVNGTCAPVPNGGECRPSAGGCDIAEVCTNGACPADGFAPPGFLCRPVDGGCDFSESCTGASAQCPTDLFFDAGVICRASTGACDPGEACTGTSGPCPIDALADAGTICRAAAGLCDAIEVCSGTQTLCPTDAKAAPSQVCRASAGPCDVVEFCTGTTDTCPVDTFLANTSLACAPNRCPGNAAACTSGCTTNANCASTSRSFCNAGTCLTGRLAFVTSSKVDPAFGGVAGGDSICQAHANDAGFGGTFRAWLSQPGNSPATRFTRDGGMWIRAISTKDIIAADWASLTDGTISNTLGHTEKGVVPPSGLDRLVWTGTAAGGIPAVYAGNVTENYCNGWTSDAGAFHGTYGQIGFLDHNWTDTGQRSPCNAGPMRLYCFEQ